MEATYYHNKKRSYGRGRGIGGGGEDFVVRNGIGEGLTVRIAFKSTLCPLLYTVNVTVSLTDLCSSI